MGLDLCGAGAWNKLGIALSTPFGVTRVQKVTVKGKATCPCGCKHTFDIELEVDQKVLGGVKDFNVSPVRGISELCPWPK